MEEQKGKCIGVIDSGLGGLTVVKELERFLPKENIIYFGDNANCPYGNRPRSEILELSLAMLDFMQNQGVKIVAVACNTISILIDELRKHFDFPIVSIIEEACKHVAARNIPETGVFATEFTIRGGLYNTLIHSYRPETKVFGVPSRTLAMLVDEGRFSGSDTKAEVHSLLNTLLSAHPEVKHVVLGCTHYPIVQDLFEEAAPDLNFINPAAVQAEAVKTLLAERGLLCDLSEPAMNIFTSGGKEPYEAAIKKLGIRRPLTITVNKN